MTDEEKINTLLQALKDIAKGNAPAHILDRIRTLPSHEFRHRMWVWSQMHARKVIKEVIGENV